MISVCNSVMLLKKPENQSNVAAGVVSNLMRFAKVLTYQLKDNDVNHVIDLANFYKSHPDLCVSDITSKLNH